MKLYRWFKGGCWIKTEKRGWIDFDTYNDYLSYGFDPIGIKSEDYDKDEDEILREERNKKLKELGV